MHAQEHVPASFVHVHVLSSLGVTTSQSTQRAALNETVSNFWCSAHADAVGAGVAGSRCCRLNRSVHWRAVSSPCTVWSGPQLQLQPRVKVAPGGAAGHAAQCVQLWRAAGGLDPGAHATSHASHRSVRTFQTYPGAHAAVQFSCSQSSPGAGAAQAWHLPSPVLLQARVRRMPAHERHCAQKASLVGVPASRYWSAPQAGCVCGRHSSLNQSRNHPAAHACPHEAGSSTTPAEVKFQAPRSPPVHAAQRVQSPTGYSPWAQGLSPGEPQNVHTRVVVVSLFHIDTQSLGSPSPATVPAIMRTSTNLSCIVSNFNCRRVKSQSWVLFSQRMRCTVTLHP